MFWMRLLLSLARADKILAEAIGYLRVLWGECEALMLPIQSSFQA